MTDGEEGRIATHLGPSATPPSPEELQRLMKPVTLPPHAGHAAARSATPPPPSEPTAMTQAARGGKTTDRLGAIEEAVDGIKDALDGLKEQFTALSDRMDGAGRKDDQHDGELVGLKAGLKDAEESIKRVETAVEAAQKTADAACRRLVEEFGEP